MNYYYKSKVLIFFSALNFIFSYGQVGIGTTTPNSSAILEINSTNSGILIPRMTLAQRNAITTPANGLLIYQTDGTTGFWYYNGTIWTNFSSAGWSIIGNNGTNSSSNYIGTNDNNDFILSTNNSERIRFQNDGDVGINTTNPISKLHITGTAPVLRIQDGFEGVNKVLTSDANGMAYWGSSANLSAPDADWNFPTSSKTIADPIYHSGKVVIGRTGTTTHQLDIDNGANTGTTFGIGNNEYIQDGNNESQFSHRITPVSDNLLDLGTSTFRWRTIYATNGTIQTSDAREKSNISNLKYGLNDLMKLNPVSYYWKKENYLGFDIPSDKKELKLGLIAQEVEQVIPEVIYKTNWVPKSEKEKDTYIEVQNKLYGINYEELLALLVKAKQEQEIELNQIKSKSLELLSEIKSLKN